jgi:membrane-associated protease RseP (regulator of RpoE activity)
MNSSFDPATGYFIEVRPRPFPWLNVILFLLTCLSTLMAGAYFTSLFNREAFQFSDFLSLPWLLRGLPFGLAVMAILFCHEMGHYLTCRYYGVDATLPYFIPFPNHVGTMGAFIKIRAPIYDRGSLLEIGVAGPIAGFVVAVVVLFIALSQPQRFIPLEELQFGNWITFGRPLIFRLIQYLTGTTTPPGTDLDDSPLGFAAWFGFLITALNLLPAAQLDGGHITYAMFRDYHKWISSAVVVILVPLAIFYWVGWFVWIGLLLVIRLRHPQTLDDSIPLRTRQVVLGIIGYLLLILCFTPAPFSF